MRNARLALPVLTTLTATLGLVPAVATAQHRHRHRQRDREETPAPLSAPATPATDPEEAAYQPAIDAANRGQPEEALRIFTEIYQSTRAPRAVARMGTTEIQLGRWLSAEEHLTAALAASSDAWVQQRRDRLEEALGRVRQNLASLTLTGGVEGARVRINGNAAGTLPLSAPVRVQRGSVMIDVQAAGHVPYQQVLSVTSADARAEVNLLRAPVQTEVPTTPPSVSPPIASQSPPAAAEAPPVTPPTRDTPAAASRSPLRPLGIASLVLGGVGLGVGVLGLVLRNSSASTFNNDPRCGAEVLGSGPSSCQDDFNTGQTMQTVSIAGFVAGGVLAAVGVSLFAVAPRERQVVAFRCGGGPGTFGIRCGAEF